MMDVQADSKMKEYVCVYRMNKHYGNDSMVPTKQKEITKLPLREKGWVYVI